ncbi:MAG TPA: 4-oxalocrotonate tautomerase family protein [Rhizomicrobium sp.]
MPFVTVHMAAGRPVATRRRLAQAITDAVTDILELDRGATQVLIEEHDRDNWAIGGELLSDQHRADALPDLDSLFKKPAAKIPAKPPAQKPAARPRSRR